MFPTMHSRMALKEEPWLAWRRTDGGEGLGDGDSAPLRAQGRWSTSSRPGQGGQVGASHLVKKHHRGFDDLPPFLELRIMVLLLGL